MNRILIGLVLALTTTGLTAKTKHQSDFNNAISHINCHHQISPEKVPFYDSDTQLFYGFYNDADNIYVLMQSNNKETAQSIVQNGAEVLFVGNYSKKTVGEIIYSPSKMRGGNRPSLNRMQNKMGKPSINGNRPKEDSPMRTNGGEQISQIREHFFLNKGTFRAEGFRKTNGMLIMDEPLDLHADINWPENRFLNMYIKIPINEIALSPYDWDKLSKKGIKLILELKQASMGKMASKKPMDEKPEGRMGRSGGGMRDGGMGSVPKGGSGGGRGNAPQMKGAVSGSSKLKFITTLMLTPPQAN